MMEIIRMSIETNTFLEEKRHFLEKLHLDK